MGVLPAKANRRNGKEGGKQTNLKSLTQVYQTSSKVRFAFIEVK